MQVAFNPAPKVDFFPDRRRLVNRLEPLRGNRDNPSPPLRRAAVGGHRGVGGTAAAARRVVAPPRWPRPGTGDAQLHCCTAFGCSISG